MLMVSRAGYCRDTAVNLLDDEIAEPCLWHCLRSWEDSTICCQPGSSKCCLIETVLISHPCKVKTSGQPCTGNGIVKPTSGIYINSAFKWLPGFLMCYPLWSSSAGATELKLSGCQQSPDVMPGIGFLWGAQNNSHCSLTCTMSFLIIDVLWPTLNWHCNLFLAIFVSHI